MKLPIIQSLWIGAPLTNLEKLTVQSFMDNGHEFHLYVYDHVQGVPDGVVVKDGNDILPASEIFYVKHGRIAPFSDYFRYALLYKLGGWWVDMDMVCIKPFDFSDEIVISCDGDDTNFSNAPMKFPAGHPLLKELIYQCKNRGGKVNYMDFFTAYGKAVKQYKFEKFATTAMCFTFPGHNLSSFLDYYQHGIDLPQITHSVHIANSIITKNKFFTKNDKFHKHSLFELLKQKHNIYNSPEAKMVTPLMLRTAEKNYKLTKRQNRNRKYRIIILIIGGLMFAAGLSIGLLI